MFTHGRLATGLLLWAAIGALKAPQDGPSGPKQITNVGVVVSHRQAIITYTAPNAAACTVDVFTDPAMTRPVNDTNTALFPGSNRDDRPGSVSEGTRRSFVAGQIPIPGWSGYSVREAPAPVRIVTAIRDAEGRYATVTTAGPHGLAVNDRAAIEGVSDSSFDAEDALVVSIQDSHTFSYANAGAANAQGAGGRFSRANRFSRTLQADTPHWFRITCGPAMYMGSFRTATVPLGSTYGELTPFDWSSAPMKYLYPSIPNVRGHEVIDPVTGVLAKRASLASDSSHSAKDYPTSFDAGSEVACPQQKTNGGYHCTVQSKQQINRLYWFGDDGSIRFLGYLRYNAGPDWEAGYLPSQAYFDADDPNVLYAIGTGKPSKKPVLLQLRYTGNDEEAPPDAQAQWSITNLTPAGFPALDGLISEFDASFSGPTFASCSLAAVQGNRLLGSCRALNQDSPAWLWVLDLGDKRPLGSCSSCLKIIAAAAVHRNPATRWCGLHYAAYVPGGDIFHFITQGLRGGGSTGPWYVTLQNAGGIDADADVITVDGEPVCDPGSLPRDGSRYLQEALPGDIFQFTDAPEYIRIIAKTGNNWTVERGWGAYPKRAHAAGATLKAVCPGLANTSSGYAPDVFWRYVDDPRGMDASGSLWITDRFVRNLHRVARDPYDIAAGWFVRKGPFPADNFNKPATFVHQASPLFAGVFAGCDGNSYQKHPSFENWNAPSEDRRGWFLDLTPFQSGTVPGETAQKVDGTSYIYRVPAAKDYPRDVKKAPYIGISGTNVLLDISGPGSRLDDSPAGHFTMCAAYQAGECWPGSVAGDMYANLPYLTTPSCSLGSPSGGQLDLCTFHVGAYGQAVVQFGVDAPVTESGAINSRVLIRGLSGAWRRWGQLTNARALPDGEWMVFPTTIFDDHTTGENTSMLARVPRLPEPDGIDRSTFVPVKVSSPPVAGAVRAVVAFGYDPSMQFRCTQRREACVAVSAEYDPADPYKFADTDAYTGVDCRSGCSITIPAISDRVVYYRWIYGTEHGTVKSVGPVKVLMSSGARIAR